MPKPIRLSYNLVYHTNFVDHISHHFFASSLVFVIILPLNLFCHKLLCKTVICYCVIPGMVDQLVDIAVWFRNQYAWFVTWRSKIVFHNNILSHFVFILYGSVSFKYVVVCKLFFSMRISLQCALLAQCWCPQGIDCLSLTAGINVPLGWIHHFSHCIHHVQHTVHMPWSSLASYHSLLLPFVLSIRF